LAELIARERPDNQQSEQPASRRTKDRLLLLLKTRGAMTTRLLAETLNISVPATRQHLKSLGGAVESHSSTGAVGRPAQRWRLTDAGQLNFPDTHSELTVRILESIENTLGQTALDAVIADRYRQTEFRYQAELAELNSISDRLTRLVQLRDEEGYMAELKKTADGWLLIENHCPICAAATACQGFCRNELSLFRDVLGESARVERVEYLLEGGRRCAYEIRGSS